MQNISTAFKNSIRNPCRLRNRAYIRVYIGVINQEAQDSIEVDDVQTDLAYFSDKRKPFEGFEDWKLYATGEQDFSRVDGSMFFLPENQSAALYNNGLVTAALLGAICISFGGVTGLDIKGLTINFGECYPVDFTVECDSGVHAYSGNTKANWVTEDVFKNVSFLIIRPTKMVNGQGRLRILQFSCGIVNIFTNDTVFDYTLKDFVSPVSETIPSQDMSLTVDNHELYYDPDNENSTLVYMEKGQEIKVSFGYDVTGRGELEWLKPNTCYLKTWKADDKQAKFTATDRFDYISGKYYGGLFRSAGISLYDLAIDVLQSAGITDEREYFIDPYLKKIVVQNPMPVVEHTQALQIIANAGRCILFQDRNGRICLQSSFIPEKTATSNDIAEFASLRDIFKDNKKDAYAMASDNFTPVDGSVFFMPKNEKFLNVGYVSNAVADSAGAFAVNPKIMVNLESGYSCFGLCIHFRNVAPEEFFIRTYLDGVPVLNKKIENPDLIYTTYEQFRQFDRLELVFSRGHPNARVTLDSILIGDVTDYHVSNDVFNVSPEKTRQQKIKSIAVERTTYSESSEKKDVSQGEISISTGNTMHTVYFQKPVYGLEVMVEDAAGISCMITESSNYYAKLEFSGATTNMIVKYKVSGYEYVVDTNRYVCTHDNSGEEKEWKNPLISTAEHARQVEEWIASYFIGNIDYKINWWGDPCVDANDLFYLDVVGKQTNMIRCYENTLKFSNAGFDGNMKARKVILHD